MTGNIVLLTGATGFIGLRILQGLLNAGYSVRAVVRSQRKGQWLIDRVRASAKCPTSGLSTIVVTDFTADGAFDHAARGASAIIHVASPITSSDDPADWERDFVTTAVKGSTEILEAAHHSKSVRRVILTSSMVAMLPLFNLFKDPGDLALNAESRSQNMQPPYPAKMMAYAAGKIAALNAAESWVEKQEPDFDIIHLCPSFVVGQDDTVTTAKELCKGSNWHPLSIILGTNYDVSKPALTCHIDDVVRCHVLGLDLKVPGDQCYLISCDGSDGKLWDDAKAFVQTDFPEAVKTGSLPNNGHMPTISTKLDVSKTERVFGFKHKSYAEQVHEVTEQYLALLAKERGIASVAASSPKTSTWRNFLGRWWKMTVSIFRRILIGQSLGLA